MLTDKAIRSAQASSKDYKLADSAGLHLFVTTKGHRSWRFKYRFGGKEKRLVFGAYPEVSLADARALRDKARLLLRDGRDPALEARKSRLAKRSHYENDFEKVARTWFNAQQERWRPVHAKDVITCLERDVFPSMGIIPIADLDAPMVLTVLNSIADRGAIETTHRAHQRISAIFDYAVGAGLVTNNPVKGIKASLPAIPPKKRRPALKDVEKIRTLMADVDGAAASPIVRLASRFMALTAQRPGMVRTALWCEFEGIDWSNPKADASKAVWRIPADRMKQVLEKRVDDEFEHVVPLAPQAVDVLRAVHRLSGRGQLAFPSHRTSQLPMSENAVGYLYNRIGYKGVHVPHGWRASFSTVMNELVERVSLGSIRLIVDRLVIDLMLAHTPEGLSESELRYNRAAYMDRRREIAGEWADKITAGLQPADNVLANARKARNDHR